MIDDPSNTVWETTSNTRLPHPVSIVIHLSQIDDEFFNVDMPSSDANFSEDKYSKANAISWFLTKEIEKIGGNAIVEVDTKEDAIIATWQPPPLSNDVEEEPAHIMYVAHLLQAGLLKDPRIIIANSVYAGHGLTLSKLLVLINAWGFNRRMAERDALLLAQAAPFLSPAWMALAIIQMDNGKTEDAVKSLDHLFTFDQGNAMALKYMGIALTNSDPKRAVKMIERGFDIMLNDGVLLDVTWRVAYGMALKEAGRKLDSKVQFDVAAGVQNPKMTAKQWTEWGYTLVGEGLKEALMDPKRFSKLPKRRSSI